MTIAHDKQGFLVGDLIAGQKELLGQQRADAKVMKDVRTDVRAIARAMGIAARSSSNSGRSPSARVAEPAGRTSSVAAARSAVAGPGSRAVAPRARDGAGRFVAAMPGKGLSPGDTSKGADPDLQRDGKGRFTAGGGAGAGDGGGTGLISRLSERMGGLGDAIRGMAQGSEQIDPAVTAMHEVKSVVEPLGRGMFAMFGRNKERAAERKKERWYTRLLNAIKGKRADATPTPITVDGGGGLGVGAMAGTVARMLPMLLAGAGTLIVAGLAGLVGTKIGGAIYDWLDKSGIATKIFDAFDSLKNWVKEKRDQVMAPVKAVQADYERGKADILSPPVRAPQLPGEGGRDRNDPRRFDRADAIGADGRAFNDPRRLDGAAELAPATSLAQSVGRTVAGIQDRKRRVNSDPRARAMQTGASYSAGKIGNLSDAQTRALVASTVMTESEGGKLDLVNSAGYMGRYQAGAGWLADAGLIKGGSESVKTAMKADGFKNEYQWGKSGGMTKFLKNEGNWNNGLSYDKYLGSATTQDAAFKTNSDQAYKQLVKDKLVTSATPPSEVAGLLKARHLAGMVGAKAVAHGGTGAADANGTTAKKYFDDVASDRGGFLASYSGATVATGLAKPAAISVPSPVPDKLPPAESVAMPQIPRDDRETTVRAVVREPIGQDVGDRSIAHIVSGGIGA